MAKPLQVAPLRPPQRAHQATSMNSTHSTAMMICGCGVGRAGMRRTRSEAGLVRRHAAPPLIQPCTFVCRLLKCRPQQRRTMTAIKPLLSSPSLLHVMPWPSCRAGGEGGGPSHECEKDLRPPSAHQTAAQCIAFVQAGRPPLCAAPPATRHTTARPYLVAGTEGILAHLVQATEQGPSRHQLEPDDPPVALRMWHGVLSMDRWQVVNCAPHTGAGGSNLLQYSSGFKTATWQVLGDAHLGDKLLHQQVAHEAGAQHIQEAHGDGCRWLRTQLGQGWAGLGAQVRRGVWVAASTQREQSM